MHCFRPQHLILLLVGQSTIAFSLPQLANFGDPFDPIKSVVSVAGGQSASDSTSTASLVTAGGSSSSRSSTGTQAAVITSSVPSNQAATTTSAGASASGTAAQGTTTNSAGASASSSGSQGPDTASTATALGPGSASQGSSGTAGSSTPSPTGSNSPGGDPKPESNNGNGNGDGSGNGNGDLGSGSGTSIQNKNSNSNLSDGELAAVIVLPILAFLAILFCLFWFCKPFRGRITTWRESRVERGAYRRALDDPVMSFAGGAYGTNNPGRSGVRESLMRPLSFGFSKPLQQTIRRKPLNYDANNIGTTNGFSSIGMALPMPSGGEDVERGHLRNSSDVSAMTRVTQGATEGQGRRRSDSDMSVISAISEDETASFVDARTEQRASLV